MKKTIRLTESQLNQIVKKVISEQGEEVSLQDIEKSDKPSGGKSSPENILSAESRVKTAIVKYIQALYSNNQKPTIDEFRKIMDAYVRYYIPSEITRLQSENNN